MPLSAPVSPRQRLHSRQVTYEGWQRDDGLFDIEGLLIGANLLTGFRKRLNDTVGHVRGCTHLTEMFSAPPTAAVQTFAGLKVGEDEGVEKPFQLDRCHALETTSETVRRYYPRWYRGAA